MTATISGKPAPRTRLARFGGAAPALLIGCLVACTHVSSRSDAATLFERGRQLVASGRYATAVPVLRRYVDEHPDGADASRAGLFLMKAHLGAGQLDGARRWCDWTVQEHGQTLEAHKCRYKLALIALLEGDQADALARLDAIRTRPDGPLAGEATALHAFLSRVRFVGEP